MSRVFSVGEETTHVADDPACPECVDGYPERCGCGGLIHAAVGEMDVDGTEVPLTRCDRCGRSHEQDEEEAVG